MLGLADKDFKYNESVKWLNEKTDNTNERMIAEKEQNKTQEFLELKDTVSSGFCGLMNKENWQKRRRKPGTWKIGSTEIFRQKALQTK